MTSHKPDHIDTDLLRRALQARDPAHGKALVPFTLTPAEMRSEAERRLTQKKPWHAAVSPRIGRRKLLIGFAATAGAGAMTYLLWPSTAIAAPGHLALDNSEPAKPAANLLKQLAADLKTQPNPTDQGGPTTYVRVQRWSMDTIHPASKLVAQDIQTWWNPDHSGHELITTLPPQPSGKDIATYVDSPPTGIQAERIEYQPGEFSSRIDEPASEDPEQLKLQLSTREPASNGPQATLRAIADVTELHHLSLAQRIAFLNVLAGVPGLAWRGYTTDRAGRRCSAFSVNSGDASTGLTQDILLIGFTGVVLGHERIALTPPPRSRIPDNTIIEYSLSLRAEKVPT
jgi:hypothetical protein